MPIEPDHRAIKRRLLVAAVAVAVSLVLAIVLSAMAIGMATAVADGWDEIGAMLGIGALLIPVWFAGSILGLRLACRHWLGTDPGLPLLIAVAAASALAGCGAAWLAAAGALPGEGWGPVVYGPTAAIVTLAALLGLRAN